MGLFFESCLTCFLHEFLLMPQKVDRFQGFEVFPATANPVRAYMDFGRQILATQQGKSFLSNITDVLEDYVSAV